jgi:hypothetical protein
VNAEIARSRRALALSSSISLLYALPRAGLKMPMNDALDLKTDGCGTDVLSEEPRFLAALH